MLVKIDADLEDIVPDFLEKRRKDMPTLWEAFQKQDFQILLTMGHKLKGNAGGYGFDQMGLLGAIIEKGAMEKDLTKIEPALKALEDYIRDVQVEFVRGEVN